MSARDRRQPSNKGPGVQALGLALSIVVCYGAAYLGQLATAPSIPTWYASLEKPWFNPPNVVFPIAWGILYTVMAVAAWLVWRDYPSRRRRTGLTAFAIQLALNVAWSWAFFGAQSPVLGLVVIVPLLAAIAWTMFEFLRVNHLAGFLMVPYLAWVSFATVLNIAILVLN